MLTDRPFLWNLDQPLPEPVKFEGLREEFRLRKLGFCITFDPKWFAGCQWPIREWLFVAYRAGFLSYLLSWVIVSINEWNNPEDEQGWKWFLTLEHWSACLLLVYLCSSLVLLCVKLVRRMIIRRNARAVTALGTECLPNDDSTDRWSLEPSIRDSELKQNRVDVNPLTESIAVSFEQSSDDGFIGHILNTFSHSKDKLAKFPSPLEHGIMTNAQGSYPIDLQERNYYDKYRKRMSIGSDGNEISKLSLGSGSAKTVATKAHGIQLGQNLEVGPTLAFSTEAKYINKSEPQKSETHDVRSQLKLDRDSKVKTVNLGDDVLAYITPDSIDSNKSGRSHVRRKSIGEKENKRRLSFTRTDTPTIYESFMDTDVPSSGSQLKTRRACKKDEVLILSSLPVHLKAIWFLYSVNVNMAMTVTFLYWTNKHETGDNLDGDSPTYYGMNVFIMFVDTMMIRVPFYFLHVLHLHGVVSVYIIFSITYSVLGYKDMSGNQYTHNAFDFVGFPVEAAIHCVLVLTLLIPSCGLVNLLFYKLRLHLYASLYQSRKCVPKPILEAERLRLFSTSSQNSGN